MPSWTSILAMFGLMWDIQAHSEHACTLDMVGLVWDIHYILNMYIGYVLISGRCTRHPENVYWICLDWCDIYMPSWTGMLDIFELVWDIYANLNIYSGYVWTVRCACQSWTFTLDMIALMWNVHVILKMYTGYAWTGMKCTCHHDHAHHGYVSTGVRCEISIQAFSPRDRIIDRYKTTHRPRDIPVTVTTC